MLPFSWNPYNIHVNFRKILSAKWKYPETNPAGSTKNCRQFWGELVLLDKQKSLPFLSHRSPRTDRHSAGRGFHAPPPLIIQTTSATTPFVLWAAPAHVDWWAYDPFPPLFNSPLCPHGPYDFTSNPCLHHDTYSHFSLFFLQWLRKWEGEAVRTSSHCDDITLRWNTHTFFSRLFSLCPLLSSRGRLLWTPQIFLITVECWGRHRSQVI